MAERRLTIEWALEQLEGEIKEYISTNCCVRYSIVDKMINGKLGVYLKVSGFKYSHLPGNFVGRRNKGAKAQTINS